VALDRSFAGKGFADDGEVKVPSTRFTLTGMAGVRLAVVNDVEVDGGQGLFQA
jgi:hypothetical protein